MLLGFQATSGGLVVVPGLGGSLWFLGGCWGVGWLVCNCIVGVSMIVVVVFMVYLFSVVFCL